MAGLQVKCMLSGKLSVVSRSTTYQGIIKHRNQKAFQWQVSCLSEVLHLVFSIDKENVVNIIPDSQIQCLVDTAYLTSWLAIHDPQQQFGFRMPCLSDSFEEH